MRANAMRNSTERSRQSQEAVPSNHLNKTKTLLAKQDAHTSSGENSLASLFRRRPRERKLQQLTHI
jgi:hypothetical protein